MARRKKGIVSRIATSLAGLALMVYGFIAALSPFLPAGAPLMALGFLMIALANPAARPLVVRMRRRWRWFNKLVLLLGSRAPESVREVIRETSPQEPRNEG